jgi:hypothetical protein
MADPRDNDSRRFHVLTHAEYMRSSPPCESERGNGRGDGRDDRAIHRKPIL